MKLKLTYIAPVVPPCVLQIMGELMMRVAGQHGAKLSTALLISLLISVWSAHAGMKVLFEGLNVTYDEEEKRDFVRRTAHPSLRVVTTGKTVTPTAICFSSDEMR